MEVMAQPFALGTVNNPNRALETWRAQGWGYRFVTQVKPETRDIYLMEKEFVAIIERGKHMLQFRRCVPIGGRGNRALVCRKADQHRVRAIALAHKLTDIKFPA